MFITMELIVVLISLAVCESIVILKSNDSTIVGRKMFTEFHDMPYASFWKIPYAKPPVRDLRFKPPIRHQVWSDHVTYDYSKEYNDTCASGIKEDCLYLSVHMPLSENQTNYFPVLVWVHEQSNLHGADFFIEEEIIVVTISYRNSILGFLNTEDDFAEGNMGVKDIMLALEWIRDNITQFNGDPNKVTVAAAGSASNIIAAFVLSSAAEDLFTRVILQSGSALSPADYRHDNYEVIKKLYSKLYGHLDEFDRLKLYNTLYKASVEQLKSVSEDLYDSTEVRNRQRLITSFGPSIETSIHAFLNKQPIEIYKLKMANKDVEIMFGYTNLESLHKLKGFIRDKKLLKYLNYNFQYLLPFEGGADTYGSKRYRTIRRKIMEFFFVNGTIGERSLRRYAKYVSDQVIFPLLRQAALHTDVSSNNVYLYRFSLKGYLNSSETERGPNYLGAHAGDEICYLFRCKSVNDVYRSAEPNEKLFVKKIARLWANFLKYGNPTPEAKDELLEDLRWKPLSRTGSLRGLNIGTKLKMASLPEEKRFKFWNQLKNEFFPDTRINDEL